jgi:hypothetical protein
LASVWHFQESLTGRVLATVHNLVIDLIKRAGHDNAAKARRYYDGRIKDNTT